MKFFRVMFGWIGVFLKSDVAKKIGKLVSDVLLEFIGAYADRLYNHALKAVSDAEATGKSSTDKYEAAFATIRAAVSDTVTDKEIDFALHGALLALTKEQEKRA